MRADEMEVASVFRDVPAALFAHDGVSPDLVRAGEPRLVRSRRSDAALPVSAPARRRASGLRRLLAPITS